jgi:hypothetical protein
MIVLIPDTEFALKKKRLGSVMPKEEDLHGAARALIRGQCFKTFLSVIYGFSQ